MEEIEKRLDDVETKVIYITEMLGQNAEIIKNLINQMKVFENRTYDDEAILKIHNLSNENGKNINENIETLTKVYGLITDNTNSVTDLYNHISEIYNNFK